MYVALPPLTSIAGDICRPEDCRHDIVFIRSLTAINEKTPSSFFGRGRFLSFLYQLTRTADGLFLFSREDFSGENCGLFVAWREHLAEGVFASPEGEVVHHVERGCAARAVGLGLFECEVARGEPVFAGLRRRTSFRRAAAALRKRRRFRPLQAFPRLP